jgi:hypothetical protein
MQNFDRASKLAKNTQNRLEVPKNRSKTLKNRTEQSLEARRRLAEASPETIGTCRRRQKPPANTKTATTEGIEGHRVTFQQPKILQASFFFFFFFSRWLLHSGIHHIPTTTDNAGKHRTGRPTSQNTKTQPKSFFFFFFSTRRVFRSPRNKKKKLL